MIRISIATDKIAVTIVKQNNFSDCVVVKKLQWNSSIEYLRYEILETFNTRIPGTIIVLLHACLKRFSNMKTFKNARDSFENARFVLGNDAAVDCLWRQCASINDNAHASL